MKSANYFQRKNYQISISHHHGHISALFIENVVTERFQGRAQTWRDQ
jgi:hydrogenase maturation factor HypF (carbamoyltransferase family)